MKTLVLRQHPRIIDILKKGTQKANEAANSTLAEIKHAMGIDYFFDESFMNEQIAKYK